MLRHIPQRVSRDVRDYDRRSPICCGATRARTRPNWQFFHLLRPSLGKTRPRHGIQMKAIGIKQQDRSERAAAKLLDNQTQGIQNLLERNAGRDHLEKMLFTGEQRLRSFALTDVSKDRLEIPAAYRSYRDFHGNDLPIFAHEFPLESQSASHFQFLEPLLEQVAFF